MIRTPVALIPYLFLIALVMGGYLWGAGDRMGATFREDAQASTVRIGGPFTLTDQNNVTRTEKDFSGRYMLVFFGFTYCPDVCPTTLAVISAALESLGKTGNVVTPVFISVDPARDTPETMKSYLSAFGSRFVGLTGTDAQIAAVAKEYRVYYQKREQEDGAYSMDHSSVIYLMGPDGKFLAHYALESGPDPLAKDLRKRLGG